MNIQTVGILAGALAIGFVIYRAAGGGSASSSGRQISTTSGDSIQLNFKDGFVMDEMGRVWV